MRVPEPAGPFIGRARELAGIVELLRSPRVRLVTLTGLGGIGKTRLATEAATRMDEDDFPDGVAFASVAELRDPSLLGETLAQQLGIPENPDATRDHDLIGHVADREMLLVIDNFEQIWGGRHLVSQLLQAAPSGFAVLVTSQRPLGIGWEHVYPVPEMSTPTAGRDRTADAVRGSEAVQFFEAYASVANPAFQVTDANAAEIAEICRQLDGLPLALELAAARLRSTDPNRLLSLLSPRLGFLRHDDGSRPERLRTMANAIAWSFSLLEEPSRRLLRRLAVFPGSFTAEQAAEIAAPLGDASGGASDRWPHRTAEQALYDALDELVNVSLLRFELRSGGESRYRLASTVREFGLAQLQESGEEPETYRAFVSSVLAMTERIKPELRGERAAEALDELEREHANIQAALRWSIAQGTAGSEEALRICTAVWSFWKQRGYLQEAEHWLRESIAAAGDEESFFLGNGYLLLGHTISDQRAGWAHYERALEIYRKHGAARYVAGTLNSLGHTAMGQGNYRRAKSLLMETLQLFEQDQGESSASDLAHVHYQLGLLSSRLREMESALEYFDQARVLWEEAGQTVDVLNAILELGHVTGELRKFAVAHDLLSWALARARDTSDLDAEGRALCELGLLEARRDDDALALTHLRAALQLYHDTGFPFTHLVTAIEALAAACSRHDQFELGGTLLGFADNWRRRTGNALAPDDEAERARIIETIKRRIGAGPFDVAWSRGQRLIQLDDVIAAVATIQVAPGPRAQPSTRRESGPGRLTKREHEVLCLLATGLKYRDIAGELRIEESTVKKFVERIYNALDVNNRTAAAAYAFQHGICRQA